MSLEKGRPPFRFDPLWGERISGSSLTPAQQKALRENMSKHFNNDFYREIVTHFVRKVFEVDNIQHDSDADSNWLVHFWKDSEKYTAIITREALSRDGLSAVTRAIMEALKKFPLEFKKFDDEDWIELMNLPKEETKRLIEALKRG